MQFTPPPSNHLQVGVSIESAGGEHRVVVSHAHNHPQTVLVRAQLSSIGWEVGQIAIDAYSVSLKGSSIGAITTLCKEIRREYGLPEFRRRLC